MQPCKQQGTVKKLKRQNAKNKFENKGRNCAPFFVSVKSAHLHRCKEFLGEPKGLDHKEAEFAGLIM